MQKICIPVTLKRLIKGLVEKKKLKGVNEILEWLLDEGYVYKHFGSIIFKNGQRDPEMEIIVCDEIEDEIKRQLLSTL
jgi:hypothetical protein